jgi:excinuclease ABC subunit B
MDFKLSSNYAPTGDQPQAIKELTEGIRRGVPFQTLLGVTGSGKTFTMANVIANIGRPTLILSHNKTLAAQLYSEFKAFFPENAVEYFVSYYDYYQPEAYNPLSDTYIEKDLAINDEIDRLRLSATAALLSGRKDVVIVSSVSCLYGIGNPDDFTQNCITLKVGQRCSRQDLMHQLVNAQYVRNDIELNRGNFRVKGETIDICISYAHYIVRIVFWDDEIDVIETLDLVNNHTLQRFDEFKIYPANIFTTTKERVNAAIDQIALDLGREVQGFIERGQPYEAKRLEERVNYDLEMIKEVGYCSGVENYSRYFDNRPPGSRPFCLLDYFPDDFLLIIDESHVTVPQIRAMYGGDASRKKNLVQYGFRLEAALDNRPLKFEEFEALVNRAIYVSATPADYELQKSEGVIVEQVIRPTGLLDPIIEVRPTLNQIDDLMEEIVLRVEKDERVLVTTLRKDSAEKLNLYLERNGVRCNYIHSGVDTLDRVKILDELRAGMFDVLIGVNLLREGLDLPQVSLVAILDADKEGFLRSHRSLTQTVGRAARHLNGKAILYADTITKSMRLTIDETMRRREKQLKYNADNNITPQAVASRTVVSPLPTKGESEVSVRPATPKGYAINSVESSAPASIAADPVVQYMTCQDIEKSIKNARRRMEEAAKRLEFMEAAQWRDEMLQLEDLLKEKKEN